MSQVLPDADDDLEAIAIPRIFSENRPAKMEENPRKGRKHR